MKQVYCSQLKNRLDIVRLVRTAYTTVPEDVYDSLAIANFFYGLRESETEQAVKLARPKTLNEASAQALEFEAVKQSIQGHAGVQEESSDDEPPTGKANDIEAIVRQVLEATKRWRQRGYENKDSDGAETAR